MEIMYTIVPFIIIGVLFYYTIVAQNKVQAVVPNPDHTIDVVGQKWSWTFNYKEANNPAVGQDVWEAGTINSSPDLYLPVGESIQLQPLLARCHPLVLDPVLLHQAGRHPRPATTTSTRRPTTVGTFPGKCAELCGTYHSAMIFNVHIVSEADYNAYLKTLVAKGQTGEAKGADRTPTRR